MTNNNNKSADATFIALKHKLMTADCERWVEICSAMPVKARVSWALRCARDVEHLARDIPEVKACNDTTAKWLAAQVTDEELELAAKVDRLMEQDAENKQEPKEPNWERVDALLTEMEQAMGIKDDQ